MNAQISVPLRAPLSMTLKVGIVSHLIMGLDYGHVTIRFEAGRPTLIERHENIRVNAGGESGR